MSNITTDQDSFPLVVESHISYNHHGRLTIEEGLSLLRKRFIPKLTQDGKQYFIYDETRVPMFDKMVKLTSDRLRCFVVHGTVCITCGIRGSYFAVNTFKVKKPEKTLYPEFAHINLFHLTSDGREILMTHDHIIPRCKGGPNSLDNFQTMCAPCNSKKGSDICSPS